MAAPVPKPHLPRERLPMADSVPRSDGAPCSFPLTIVVRHPREKPQKCSILPLKGRPDLIFVDYPPKQALNLEGYVRLAVAGPQLGPSDRECGILLLDASWRSVPSPMNDSFAHVPPRSLSGFSNRLSAALAEGNRSGAGAEGFGRGPVHCAPSLGQAQSRLARSLFLGR